MLNQMFLPITLEIRDRCSENNTKLQKLNNKGKLPINKWANELNRLYFKNRNKWSINAAKSV